MGTHKIHPLHVGKEKEQSDFDGVTVLIISHRGRDDLQSAIQSVLKQDYSGRIHLVVVGDNTDWKDDDLIPTCLLPELFESFSISSVSSFRNLPTVERVARLRNLALAFVREPYVCFLDDDNLWERDHLSSLFAILKSSHAIAAYSWHQIVDPDGEPRILDSFPWGGDSDRAAELLNAFREAGIMDRQSNVFRDSAEIIIEGKFMGAVDMGAWLFNGSIFDSLRFETHYSEWEIENSVTEDDKLLFAINKLGLTVVCSRKPTLIYRLGGYSNRSCEANV